MNIAIAIIVVMVAPAQSLLCYKCQAWSIPTDNNLEQLCKPGDRVWCKGEKVCSTITTTFLTGLDEDGKPVDNWIKIHDCMEEAEVEVEYAKNDREDVLAPKFKEFSDYALEIELCEEELCNSDFYLKEPVCNKTTIDNGVVSPDTLTIESGSTYSVTCDEGFVISGSPTINCDGGQLSELPTCKIGECMVELAEVKNQIEIAECPEQPTWSVPKQLLGKKITKNTVKKLMKKPETQNVGYALKKYKGTAKLTKELAKYIECYTDMTEA